MAKSWMETVNEAKSQVTGVTPTEAHQSLQDNPEAVLIEVRDAESVPGSERANDVAMISLGTLPIRADLELPEHLRDPRLQDRSRQIIVT